MNKGQLPPWAQRDELLLLYGMAKPGLSCTAGTEMWEPPRPPQTRS